MSHVYILLQVYPYSCIKSFVNNFTFSSSGGVHAEHAAIDPSHTFGASELAHGVQAVHPLYAKDNVCNTMNNIPIRASPLGVSKIIFTLHYFSPTGGLEITLSNDVESNPGPPRR